MNPITKLEFNFCCNPLISTFYDIRWAESECIRQELELTKENKRKVLGDSLNMVRFPLMNIEEFAQGPAQSGILTDREVVDLFLYFTLNPKPRVCTLCDVIMNIVFSLVLFHRFDSLIVHGVLSSAKRIPFVVFVTLLKGNFIDRCDVICKQLNVSSSHLKLNLVLVTFMHFLHQRIRCSLFKTPFIVLLLTS